MLNKNDTFQLYDLKVETIEGEKPMVCSHRVGDSFHVIGENLVFNKDTKISMYSLAGLIPILPVKQRFTDQNDWISTDSIIACVDPNCGGKFKIRRMKKRTFKHSEVTIVPLTKGDK